MKITVLKSTVDTSLSLISKIISNAKLPSGIVPMLTIQSDKRNLWIGTTLPEQQFFMTLADAVYDDRNAAFSVSLEAFKQSISALQGTLYLEQENDHLAVSCDGKKMASLEIHTPADATMFAIPASTDSTILPVNFASFILQAFSCASTDQARQAITGINVSPKGIAGTDGRQLYYLPLPIKIGYPITLPPSKNYNALKSLRWNILEQWETRSDIMFAITGEGFKYIAKAINQPYPNYWQVIPKDESNDISFTLEETDGLRLLAFLNATKEEAFTDITVFPDRIELDEEALNQKRHADFLGRSTSTNLPFRTNVNTAYLKQFLKMGFRTFCTSSKAQAAIVSANGIGKYLFMPCMMHSTQKIQTAPQSVPATDSTNPKSMNTSIPSTTTPTTTTNKQEKTNMNPNINTPASPVRDIRTSLPQSQVSPTPPQPNSLEETLASFTAMREQLTHLENVLVEAGRRLKAAMLEQRQKERIYQDATRKLERIRLAV